MQIIVAGLALGITLRDLAKELGRDKRTLVSFVENPNMPPLRKITAQEKIFPPVIGVKNGDRSTRSQMDGIRSFIFA